MQGNGIVEHSTASANRESQELVNALLAYKPAKPYGYAADVFHDIQERVDKNQFPINYAVFLLVA